MTKPRITLRDELSLQLAELKKEFGEQVALDDVGSTIETVLSSLTGELGAADLFLHNELRGLVDYIHQAKSEISAIQPKQIQDTHIPTATDELDAVVKATEEAADSILEAAEDLEGLAEELGGDAAEKIIDIVTKIYEASSFQDITGQRITKVVGAIRHIEEALLRLSQMSGHDVELPPSEDAPVDGEIDEEADLLNGPQLESNANSQDDIDALFASFD